ncbi:hypothetical protein M3666_07175 [Curtobacterium sp. ODYSSEY 48 V2]|uniref:hypothetical protein n=1 Tax=Curtobacterium sp. ODYSSEY 48 V2 TaxID=2939561 RepID=UPI00203B4367|nr:hypothetical protein [Curtobacterium sp. ODYSSEY 48 V2]MCM3504890.1 hypothetical protein [Curtobacterium sp. ODYSSEY 48 V2]
MLNNDETWNDDERKLFEIVPLGGATIGNIRAQKQLGWDEGRYWSARDALVDRGLIGRGVGRGGTLFRVSDDHEEPEVQVVVPLATSATPATVEAAAVAAVAAVQREDGLYEPLAGVIRGAWARDHRSNLLAVEIVARQGRRATGGTWSRPDIVSVEVLNLLYVPTKILEVVTFEVKPADAIDVQCVYESLAHRRAATHAYVVLHVPASEQAALTEVLQGVLAVARSHGVGVVTFADPSDYDTWEELAPAERVEPDPERLNAFIDNQLPDSVKNRLARELR